MNIYLLVIWYDVEPELFGPFTTEKARLRKAQTIRNGDPDKRHGLFRINSETRLEVHSFGAQEIHD